MVTRYDKIVNEKAIATIQTKEQRRKNLQKVYELAKQERVNSAKEDKKKRLLILIDPQNDFMPQIGSLPVEGAIEDIKRITDFIYRNNNSITKIMCTQDTHQPMQIFHPKWWKDRNGNIVEPYTVITYEDYQRGIWLPTYGDTNRTEDYLKNMESIQIWPEHCIEGEFGWKFEGQLLKMIYFWAVTRNTIPDIVKKGTDPYSEMFGAIKAEYDPTNRKTKKVIKAAEEYDEIYIAGEASSHCLPITVKQIIEEFIGRQDIISKITILEDCTSPVKGCEDLQKEFFNEFRNCGIRIANSQNINL